MKKQSKKVKDGRETPKPASPLGIFFKLGDKVTGGDPERKMNFDYCMLWIIFLAFSFVFLGNLYNFFFDGYHLSHLGWALFGMAIMWFQYFNLKNFYHMREYQKENKNKTKVTVEKKEKELESIEEMLEGFK